MFCHGRQLYALRLLKAGGNDHLPPPSASPYERFLKSLQLCALEGNGTTSRFGRALGLPRERARARVYVCVGSMRRVNGIGILQFRTV